MDYEQLNQKARWIRRETLKLHRTSPQTRIASSLSCVELLTAMFYGGVVHQDPANPRWEERDRFVISKGHGSISFYPVLCDRGFVPRTELELIGRKGGILKVIPDTLIPGYESINGSVGQGLGTACGMAVGLRTRGQPNKVFVLCGDGEFHEGSLWEATMFAAHQQLANLILVVDNNKRCMLGWSGDFISLEPMEEKFKVFGWDVYSADGHDVRAVHETLMAMRNSTTPKPKVLVAHTIKGKGVPRLEIDPLCHVRSLSPAEIDVLLEESK